MLGRKEFLGLATAFAAGAGHAAGQEVRKPSPVRRGTLRLRAGVFSDLHIRDAKSVGIVEKALRHFRKANVGVVICTGDVADTGVKAQLDLFEAAWNRVFPSNRGADGQTVERVVITGNHDLGYYGAHPDPRQIQHHETFLGERLVPAFVKTVKGYTFVCQNWCNCAAVREQIRTHAAELKGTKPFFYLQHSPLRDTIPYGWIADDGKTTAMLEEFPNCIALTGHSHWPLADERSLWQGAFTALNCGSMLDCDLPGGRENARNVDEANPKTAQMKPINSYNDAQAAMVMEVYDRAIVFSRWDAKNDLPIGADWIVPWPISDGSASVEARAGRTPPPRFSAEAKVAVRRGKGTDRAGKTAEQVFVEFPNCRVMDGSPSRAFDFEVALETQTWNVVRPRVVKRVFSRGFYRAEAKDEATVVCAFGLDELPPMPKINERLCRVPPAYRFVVRPCNSFGAMGPAIASAWSKFKV